MPKPRVILADDHPLILEGLHRVLEGEYDIVANALNGQEAIEQVSSLRPELVILDIGMPIVNGLEAARRLTADVPETRIVFVSQKDDPEYIRRAFDVGASGFVLKQAVSGDLLIALRLV